jgi:hypothetical protein
MNTLAVRLARQDDVRLTLLRVTRPSAELNMEVEERALKDLVEDVIGGRQSRWRSKSWFMPPWWNPSSKRHKPGRTIR